MRMPWSGRDTRPSPARDAALQAQQRALSGFFDLETRLSYLAGAVAAVHEFFPHDRLGEEWSSLRTLCSQANDRYLNTSQEFAFVGGDSQVRRSDFDYNTAGRAYADSHRDLAAAATELDRFRHRHLGRLTEADQMSRATPTLVRAAMD